MNLAVVVAPDFNDWEKFQSIIDAAQQLFDIKYLVTHKPHKLLSLYCKTDCIVDCYINSLTETDKYSEAIVFRTAKYSLAEDCETLCYRHIPYWIYHGAEDEFYHVHVPRKE